MFKYILLKLIYMPVCTETLTFKVILECVWHAFITNILNIVKLKLFTHEKSKQSCVGVRTPFNMRAYNCSISVPCWNQLHIFYKTIFSIMKIILMEEKRNLELYLLELLQTTECTLKGNGESQRNLTSHLCFNKMKIFTGTLPNHSHYKNWHTLWQRQ